MTTKDRETPNHSEGLTLSAYGLTRTPYGLRYDIPLEVDRQIDDTMAVYRNHFGTQFADWRKQLEAAVIQFREEGQAPTSLPSHPNEVAPDANRELIYTDVCESEYPFISSYDGKKFYRYRTEDHIFTAADREAFYGLLPSTLVANANKIDLIIPGRNLPEGTLTQKPPHIAVWSKRGIYTRVDFPAKPNVVSITQVTQENDEAIPLATTVQYQSPTPRDAEQLTITAQDMCKTPHGYMKAFLSMWGEVEITRSKYYPRADKRPFSAYIEWSDATGDTIQSGATATLAAKDMAWVAQRVAEGGSINEYWRFNRDARDAYEQQKWERSQFLSALQALPNTREALLALKNS